MISEYIRARAHSFIHAFKGIHYVFAHEPNAAIHLVCAIIALLLSATLKLSPMEWCLILLAISMVFAGEIINSAIEKTVDLCTDEFHPLAEKAKDMAAGAVLVFAIGSLLIGLIIFLPKIIHLL